jgi:DNA excision repair protein ERCC-2
MRQQDVERLNTEYRSLLRGLNLTGPPTQPRPPGAALTVPEEPSVAVNPVLPDDVVNEAIPENIRKASEYVHLLEKFTQYLKGRLALRQVIQETPVRPNVVRSVEKTVH